MKWLIHIGITKTGSKAIQQFLASEAEALTERRIVYLKTGRSGIWHEDLFYSLENRRTDLLAAARQEGLSERAEYAVLSYEGFYQLPTDSIRLVRDTVGEAQILLFIRRQDSHANSWYNQLIKAHRVPISAIEEFERNVTAYDPTLDHSATLERWSSVFGRDALEVVTYDKRRSSVDVLLDALGVTLSRVRWSAANANPALTPELAATLRGIKSLLGSSPDLPQIVERFHQCFASAFADTYGGDPAYLLSRDECTAIMTQYTESNEHVRRQWFAHRDTLFDPFQNGPYASLDLAQGLEQATRFLAEHFPARLT